MIAIIVVAALCQALLKQIQCQARPRLRFLQGLVGQQVQRQEGQGRAGDWTVETGTAVPRLSL